ncbi:class I SAM-dependent methyltransferase [Tenggerimyces flavus]|uniref:Class I SAM-dependent methyltransferase n=1 Tax=Tenggerimyces flavus TaxID=1708749 RepID=A0ABV7Y7C1_9ACTN|nr:class I SAM-dependent methyltransferase [Tenggerimyces flavus]MBM7788425.1 SAM-dependent methyltransferase [Tenggerimyces flavus]
MIPDRVRAAVDLVDPQPGERILELGGGPGVSAGLVCARLGDGQLLAVDRSAVAVQRTEARNAEHLAAGRLVVRQASLEELDLPAASLDKAFCLNVNLFWTRDPAHEVAILRAALKPQGTLHVLYGTDGPSSADRVTAPITAALRAGGFETEPVRTEHCMGVRAW